MARGKLHITTTISPAMLDEKTRPIMEVHEIDFEVAFKIAKVNRRFKGCVGHRNTADKLGEILHMSSERLFGRDSLNLKIGDRILAFIPQFRDTKAREFTDKEINENVFRIFYAELV